MLSLVCVLSGCGGGGGGGEGSHDHIDRNGDGICDNGGEPMGGGNNNGTGDDNGNGNGDGDDNGGDSELKPFDPTTGAYTFGDKNYYVPTDGLLPEQYVDDNYGTFYEIGVQSYCDSNGDNVGDLKGITSRLPYIRSMGYTGIWLTPIVDSWPRQYGYGAKDYFKIYPAYGTFADFDELIEKAHSIGIKVICDLAFNHTSDSGCSWWNQALAARKSNNTSSEYYNFYHFSRTRPTTSNWEQRDGLWFECSQYYGGMPDLNLAEPKVKAKLAEVIKLWVDDHHIDGIRLDAVKDYFSEESNVATKTQKNMEFVNWVVSEAKKYNPDIYVIGEVYSGRGGTDGTDNYCKSTNASSYFWFEDGYFPGNSNANQNPWHNGTIGDAVNTVVPNGSQAQAKADNYFNSMQNMISGANGKIPAPFLDQHDTDRIGDKLFARNATKIKFAYGLLQMYTGNTFSYYGDEIAMRGIRTMSQSDEERRMGFLWDTSKPPKIVAEDGEVYKTNYSGVTGALQQIADEASILRYYQAANNLRNAFPAIIRGTPSKVSNNGGLLTIKKTWNSQTVYIVINFTNGNKTVSAPTGTTFQKALCPAGTATATSLPAYSIAVYA